MRNRYAVAGKIGSLVLSGILAFVTPDLSGQSGPAQRLQSGQMDLTGQRVGQFNAPSDQNSEDRGVSPNATCDGAIVVTLEVGSPVTVTGNNSESVFDGILGANVVWEAFTTSECANVTVSYCGTTPAFGAALITLGVGCPLYNLAFNTLNNASTTACLDGNYTILFPDLPAGTYYYPVLEATGSSGPYALTFTATACSDVFPANALCSGAVEIVPDEACTPVQGSVEFATRAGNSGPGCSDGDVADGVWFSFVATSTIHSITVVPNALFSAQFTVFEGDCTTPSSIACAEGPNVGITTELEVPDLTIGNTYFVRVADWYAGVPRDPNFTICIKPVATIPCDATAGTLTADEGTVCYEGVPVTLSATQGIAPEVPPGFEIVYLLTNGQDFLILDSGPVPSFTFESVGGEYTIHTLVYDPTTLDLGDFTFASEMNALLIQGGGTVCGSLDLTGAPILVDGNCAPPCDAQAGTLTAVSSTVCFVAPEVTVAAVANGDAVVPTDFTTIHLLTLGPDQVIVDGSFTGPSFAVEATGSYTILTLVYDPSTFPLGSLTFGVSTGGDVDALLIQGGGTICGSLDLTGAPIVVEECVTPCDANAGTLTAISSSVCFENGTATIGATANGDDLVPSGFETVYVLTFGPDLVIVAAGADASFDVTAVGAYTIHGLVYDPTTLDLGSIELGVTTGGEVNDLLIQGGGTICGSLDVTGAPIIVEACLPPCDADAGTLTANEATVCSIGDPVTISATQGLAPEVPPGFEIVFVLTSGQDLVIQDAGPEASFSVPATGLYTIHTLVYDPSTLDLGTIVLGETTGGEVNALLIQGGGTICASLDLVGAPVSVIDCRPVNDDCASAIEIPVNAEGNCPAGAIIGDNTYATEEVENTPGCDATVVYFADVWYTFNSGSNTEVTISLDPMEMEDWGITVSDACSGGTEILCEFGMTEAVVLTTLENTTYWVRVVSNVEFGEGGEFALCLSGTAPTFVCNGGEVYTMDSEDAISVCQDGDADVIDFITTSTSAENYGFVVTDEGNTIITLMSGNSLDFNAIAVGAYRVWGISYNGDLEGADPGSLATEVTSTGDCLELSSNFVVVNVEICSGIAVSGTDTWSLYPNPADGAFNVRFSGVDGRAVIEVIDMDGRLVVQEMTSVTDGHVITVSTAGRVAAGLYTVRLTSGSTVRNVRLVLQ